MNRPKEASPDASSFCLPGATYAGKCGLNEMARQRRPAASPEELAERKSCAWAEVGPHRLLLGTLKHSKHRVVFAKNSPDRTRCMDAKRLQFAQQQQAENMVEISIDEHCPRDGRLPYAVARLQSGVASICARRSGEAPSKNHDAPVGCVSLPELTAT